MGRWVIDAGRISKKRIMDSEKDERQKQGGVGGANMT